MKIVSKVIDKTSKPKSGLCAKYCQKNSSNENNKLEIKCDT